MLNVQYIVEIDQFDFTLLMTYMLKRGSLL